MYYESPYVQEFFFVEKLLPEVAMEFVGEGRWQEPPKFTH
jgi:hypothetical protein